MKIQKLICCLLITAAMSVTAQQTYVNREYQDTTGSPTFNPILNPFGIRWSKTINSSGGGIITVGHTAASGQGENIYLIKLDNLGNVVFQVSYNTSGTNNDYGTDVIEISGGDIYVCGTTDNGGSTDYDAVILRYSSGGSLLGTTTFTGSAGLNDIGTALKLHPTSGHLLVAVCNENSGTSYDYRLLELNASTLTQINANSYDYANLIDIPLGIEINSSTGNITLVGGSQSSFSTSAYAEAEFNGSTLSYITDARTDLSGSPNDEAAAFVKDGSNNIYITGKTQIGAQYNIKTVKINASYSIAWTSTLDAHGLDDAGLSIAYDPINAQVLVGGYATKSNNKTEAVCIAYDASSGSQNWIHEQSAENGSGDAAIKKLSLNSNGDLYFSAQENAQSGYLQTAIGKIDAAGHKGWERKVYSAAADVLPSDILCDSTGVSAISVLDSLTNKYLISRFTELTLDTSLVYASTGSPLCKKNELIVRFYPNVMDTAAVDNTVGTKIASFGKLSDFITPAAYSQVTLALVDACRDCDIKAVKIFDGLKTTDTISTSRLGEQVRIPEFWATLLLSFPSGHNIGQINYALNHASGSVIDYAHPDYVGQLHGPTNDSLYYLQTNLHASSTSTSSSSFTITNAHINMEPAWQIAPEGGKPFVRVGIFDSGVNWAHKEFGYDGVNPNSSSLIDGWDYNNGGVHMKTLSSGGDNDDHGTPVAGIIAAGRNNSRGIAGIAGGNDSTGNKSVSLYGMKVSGTTAYAPVLNSTLVILSSAANAIMFTSLYNPTLQAIPYEYGVHVSNNSYGFTLDSINNYYLYADTNLLLLDEALHFANRNHVTTVCSRGNMGPGYINYKNYPSGSDDKWLISVGGTGTDGYYCHVTTGYVFTPVNCDQYTEFGYGIDVGAPAAKATLTTTGSGGGYRWFGATSGAAPHVTGVVALLMSYMNDSTSLANGNNLAPEDCEEIIQRSATDDTYNPGYDDFMGWGRLNAGKALKMVEKPYNRLHHFNTNGSLPYSTSKSLVSANDTVKLIERYQNKAGTIFPKGKYVLDSYKITAIVSHTLPTYDTIMAFWPRHSSSQVLEARHGGGGYLRPHECDTVTQCSTSSATLVGYIYKVRSTQGSSLGWWPMDTTLAVKSGEHLFAYSVLTRDYSNKVSLDGVKKDLPVLSCYPNPASNLQTIVINGLRPGEQVSVDLYDLMGRRLGEVYNGVCGTKVVVEHNVQKLPNSMYFYIIKSGEQRQALKFIKE